MSSSGNLVAIVNWKFVAKIDKKGKELKSISIGAGDTLTIDGVMKQVHTILNNHNSQQPNDSIVTMLSTFMYLNRSTVLNWK